MKPSVNYVAIAILAFGVSSLSFADTAVDETTAGQRTTTLSTAGLNLDDPGEAEKLYSRIKQAARRVCRFDPGRTSGYSPAAMRACTKGAITDAVISANQPQLTAVHERSPLRLNERLAGR